MKRVPADQTRFARIRLVLEQAAVARAGAACFSNA